MTTPVVDPSRCPLCGGSNECGVAKGATNCWCFSSTVPAEVLEQLPPELRNVACVCQRCASGQRAPAADQTVNEKSTNGG